MRWSFLLLFLAPVAFAQCPEFEPGDPTGTVLAGRLDEISGLAASRTAPGVLWVHNDSGDNSRIYTIDLEGQLLGTYTLGGVFVEDGEDIAIGPGPEPGVDYVYYGDIGDNDGVRPFVHVYRFPEPAIDPAVTGIRVFIEDVETITLAYPDGARDAETLLIDPLTRDLYVITKREARSRIYRAGWPQSTTTTTTLEFVGALRSGFSTGGDVSPDGTEVLVRSLTNVYGFVRDPAEPLWPALIVLGCPLPMGNEPQGEAIGYDAAGRDYFTLSEGDNPPIYRYRRIQTETTAPHLRVH